MSCAGSEAPLCTHVRGRRRVASRLRASPPSFRPEAKNVRKGCRTSTQAHSPVNCAAGSTARRSGGQPTLYSTAATATRAEARRQDHLSCSFMTASDSCFVHVTTSADASLRSSVKGSLMVRHRKPSTVSYDSVPPRRLPLEASGQLFRDGAWFFCVLNPQPLSHGSTASRALLS